MKFYKKVSITLFISILTIVNLQAGKKESVETILAMGEQMSNVRNMLENYSLIATKVTYKSPEDRLVENIAQYEKLMEETKKNFKDKEIQKSIKISKKAWKPVKKALLTATKEQDVKKMEEEGLFIHGNIRSVIRELANIKKFLLEKEKVKDSELLNASIEISASARRLSAHYMMKMWGLDDPTIEKHWNKGVEIYTNSIKLLKASEYYKDPKFKKLLNTTQKHLKYFTMVILFDDKYVPVLVQEKAKSAFESANEMSAIILAKIIN